MGTYSAPTANSEADLLKPEVRKKLIEAWLSKNNEYRKAEAFKAYECLKDQTKNYVLELLLKQFDTQTVVEMQFAITNVSVYRKVIHKLAKVYSNGAKRSMPKKEPVVDPNAPVVPGAKPAMGAKPADPNAVQEPNATEPAAPAAPDAAPPKADAPALGAEDVSTEPTQPGEEPVAAPAPEEIVDPDTEALEQFAKYLKLDEAMRKCDRYFRAFHNALVFPKPVDNGDGKMDLQIEILPPFHYDVVEDPNDPKRALAVVLSDYATPRKSLYFLGDAATAGRTKQAKPINEAGDAYLVQQNGTGIVKGDATADNRRWTWWTKSYHFITDSRGAILPFKEGDAVEEGNKNPILTLPFVNFSGEQDDCFWAQGGEDLVDSAVQINTDLSHLRNILVTQGYGQLYLSGKNLPKSLKVGPQHAVLLEYDKDNDPKPEVGFLNSNAPVEQHQKAIELFVALMLTTNNLSVSTVSSSLSGGKDFASGIAMMIDKSESIEDINEQSKVFIEKEPKVLEIASKWYEVYKSKLTDEAKKAKPPKEVEKELITFPTVEPIVSETERLAALKARKDLGLNTMVELIQRDNPGMSTEEAQQKLEKIKAEKQANAAAFGTPQAPGAPGVDANGNQSQTSDGEQQPNNVNVGPRPFGPKASGANQNPNQK